MKRKLLILSLLAIALTACTEKTIIPSAQQQVTNRSVNEKVRVVPLRIYMGKKTSSRTAGVAPTFETSFGEKTHSDHDGGMGTSVARNLTFYVYARTANSADDFQYDETKSSALNTTTAGGLKAKTFFTQYDQTTFYTAEVSFEKEQGKEYKILVTASGAEEEKGYVGTTLKTPVPNLQSAKALTYQTNDAPIKNGDKLSDLKAKVVNESVYIPQIRTGNSTKDIDYENTPAPFYGLQECFYGFCESRSATSGDKNIITYEDPSALRAYLVRNVARVEFKFTNINYENNYSFPWIGIYASQIGTESDAHEYSYFRTHSTIPIIDETNGTLVAYYDEKGMGYETMSNGFGTTRFSSTNPGSYSFVTYMLPTITSFKFRVQWNRETTVKYKYCHTISLPLTDSGGIGGYDESGTAILAPIPFEGDKLKIECNRNYIITVDCGARLKTTD